MKSVVAVEQAPVGNPAQLDQALCRVIQCGARGALVLACDEDVWTPSEVDPVLRSQTVPVFGGVFPNLIRGAVRFDTGVIVVGLSQAPEVFILEGLSSSTGELDARVRDICSAAVHARGLVTIVDGLAGNLERFVESLYGLVGRVADTVGCGAGSLDFVQKPCLFTNRGLIQDAALVASMPSSLARGAKHGWRPVHGPYLVTGSSGNLLESLNYRPAFSIYREHVEAASGQRFDEHNFFALAKTFPLGVERLDGEILVRDPIRLENECLVCVGEIPENAMLYILKGESESLIASARDAACEARKPSARAEGRAALIFDCISRGLFLADDFEQELTAIGAGLGSVDDAFGALTLGEITNNGQGQIDFLNNSTVIGVF